MSGPYLPDLFHDMVNITSDDTNSTAVLKLSDEGRFLPGKPLSDEDIASFRIENCELISKLGSGGMGTVFLAKQTQLDRLVAIKCLRLESLGQGTLSSKLAMEAVTMAALNHPNIVGCYDVKFDDKYAFIIMEFVPGETSVKDLVMRCRTLPESIVVKILIEAINGLMYIHGKGYVHHDLKPANILIYNEENIVGKKASEIFASPNTRIKICDFGIASKSTGKSVTDDAGNVIGSPNYMAPEQLTAPLKADFRSDIYALAGTALFMLTGKPPFDISNRILLMECKLTTDMPSPIQAGAKVSAKFSQIIAKMGRLDPDERYQSYSSLLGDLMELQERLHAESNIGFSARKASFWKRISLVTFGFILVFLGYFANQYINDKFFKVKMISFTDSPGFWSGDIAQWSIEQKHGGHGNPMVMSASMVTTPISLKYPIMPGQNIDIDVNLVGVGKVVFGIKDDVSLDMQLSWSSSDGEQINASLVCNETVCPSLAGISSEQEWHSLSFSVMRTGIILYVDGEMTYMSTIPYTGRSIFSVQTDINGAVQLKNCHVYTFKRNSKTFNQ